MSASRRPNNLKEGEVCPACGTIDCLGDEAGIQDLEVSSTGTWYVSSDSIIRSCRVRQMFKEEK